MRNILDWIEEKKQQYESPGPRTMAQEPRNMAHGGRIGLKPGGIVEPGVEYYGRYPKGSEPGLLPGTYSGDFKTWYETADIKGQTPLEKYGPFKDLKKGIRGAIKSRDYPRWLERKATSKDLRKTGHIPLEEFFAKHDVPDHYRTQMEFTSTSGRRKFNRSWFKKNLEKHVVNLEFSQAGGGGLFIKEPGKKLTEEFVKVFKTPDVTIRPNTVTNINKLWKVYGESHYAKGTFPPIEEVIKKMGGKFDMTSHAAATATRRISQIMNGTNFIGTNGKYISTNVIADKKAAKGILNKFQGAGFHTPYGGANYKINLEIVKDGLPEYTKGQSLYTWRDNARAILKDHGVKFYIKNKQAGFNLNELTGMGSGAQHGSYTSTQFVNLMEGKFNQTKHASLLKKYGEFEGKIKSSLSGPKPNVTKAKKLNKEWIDWRKNWLEGVDSKLKPQVSKILPGFDFRANAAEKVFGKKRLNELLGHRLDVAGEARELGYLKTFGAPETMRKMPILKEVALGEKKAIGQILKTYQNVGIGKNCKAYGGRVGFAEAGAVGVSQCMNNAIQEHNKNLQSEDLTVRNAARSKQFNINKTKNMKSILDLGGKGVSKALRFGKAWGAEWEPVFEGAFYEWGRRKGLTHDQAKEETFFYKMADPKRQTGIFEGAESLLEKELYEIKGENEFIDVDNRPPMQDPEFGQVIGERGTVKRYVDNEKALNAAYTKYNQLYNDYNIVSSGRERYPEKAEGYAKAMEKTWGEINSLEDKLDLDRDSYQAAVEKQQTELGVAGLKYGEYGSGDTEKLVKQREIRRQKAMEDKFPLMSKVELNKKLEDAGLYVDPKLRYKGQTVQRPKGLKFLPGWTTDTARDYFRDLDKSAYFADNFRMEKAGGGMVGIRKPSAIAPTGGPMDQGLRSLYINDKDY